MGPSYHMIAEDVAKQLRFKVSKGDIDLAVKLIQMKKLEEQQWDC